MIKKDKLIHPNFYENLEDANRRLNGTMVKYGEEFFAIQDIRNTRPIMTLQMQQYGNKRAEIKEVLINDELFNGFRPFPLGMCNNGQGRAVYIQRRPLRTQQQGTTSAHLVEIDIENRFYGDAPAGRLSVLFGGKPFLECAKGIYPSFKEVIDFYNNPEILNSSTAFCREFAVVRGYVDTCFIADKGGVVARYDTMSGELIIAKSKIFLKETFEQMGIFENVKGAN